MLIQVTPISLSSAIVWTMASLPHSLPSVGQETVMPWILSLAVWALALASRPRTAIAQR